MSAPSPSQGRPPAGSVSQYDLPAIVSVPTQSVASREPSVTRGRALTGASGRGSSSRAHTPAVGVPRIATSHESGGGLERKPSSSYGHHRQTSIVHGIQHSRNTSFVNSSATSPLNPQVIAAAAAGLAGAHTINGSTMMQDGNADSPILNGNVGSINGNIRHVYSASTLNSDRTTSDGVSSAGQRRPERKQSEKSKRDPNHHRSQSRHQHHPQQELKTVGEYALHHLFNAFVGQADQKISQCVDGLRDEPRVELICGPGVDPAFDQLISALGHIARQKPKPLIDTLMFWRKGKSEYASNVRAELTQGRGATTPTNGVPRRNTESTHATGDVQPSDTALLAPFDTNLTRQQAVIQAERRSTVSIYLLCRVLMEIIRQTDLASVTLDMADRLQDIIYGQLKSADPESLEASPLRQANWLIFGQLLGVMSEIFFEKISKRFIEDLEIFQKHLAVKSIINREIEGRTVLVIRGMRHLRVKFDSEDAWSRSCDFMQALAKLAVNAHGQPVKYAYCQLFRELLLPIAANATCELNVPKWRTFIEILKPKLVQLLMKPKHWPNAFPLMAVFLCASPVETFASQWLQLVLPLQPKLKERSTRAIALRAICRLVWVYLYRASDTQLVAAKKLDEVIRLIFQPGKRSYLSTETSIAEPLIQLIRIIGFKHQELCFRTVVFPLLNSESFMSGRDLRVEQLEPERMVIGIRAFLAIMTDLEKGEQPPFPVTFDNDLFFEPFELGSLPLSPRPAAQNAKNPHSLGEDRLSRPVMITGFGDVAKDAYVKFCKILGEITIICDNTFGGQAVLDEKFSLQTPKTPMAEAFSFARRDDYQGSADPRQAFYDLLHVAVQALPRCLSSHIQFNSLVNLLCTGTAHVQSHIAASSAQSLKSIARQSHAQQVTIGFARFIFNFDDRYATMSDGGMLGPGHIESTLRLYVELLQIWIEEIKQKTKRAAVEPSDESHTGSRGAQLDLSGVWAHVDEIESHGLFFLCSSSRRVRAFAVTVLRLITVFDTALGKSDSTRIIRIMEGSPQKVMNVNDEKLSLAERSRLQRGMRKSNLQSTLVELCSSDAHYDATLWFKVFPNLVRISFEICPFAVTLTRDIICVRLSQMQKTIGALAEGPRTTPYSVFEFGASRSAGRLATTLPEVVVEQWKLYLIFACTTLTNAGGQQASSYGSQHMRKSSKSSQQSQEKIGSAAELFARVVPFMSVSNASVRDAVVMGLGSINVNLYRTLLESLESAVVACNDEAKMRLALHQRTITAPRRSRRTDHLRTEITHVYKLTSHFLQSAEAYTDEFILNNLVNYTKDLRLFLNDAEVQNEWEFQKLRTHYCGLVEELFEGINKTKDPLRWMPFQARKAAFALMEDWCGYSPNQQQIRQREDTMRRSMLDREPELESKGIVTAAMEIEKRDLRTAALSAMATLCSGPISITTDSKVNLQFDVWRMLSWIDTIFDHVSDRSHAIGRRALKNLIVYNKEHPYLLARSLEKCYMAKSPKALESYFEVVTEVLTEREDFALPFWKTLCACLYTLGNENNGLRMKSARLLRTLEERQQKSSKLQDLDISISDKTIAVYKLAQFEMSRRLAKQHPELAFHVFSEFSRWFKDLLPDHQRNMVAAMLPWIQTVELQIDPNRSPTATTYMLLVNLFEITVRCGNALHNEIQALWQALATGPHGGNVQLVLDFIIGLCLEKNEQNFVEYAKQIVVHLSSTPAGLKVVEFLLLQITPKTMVYEKRDISTVPPEATALPYLADLYLILPIGNKKSEFSLGHLCFILLVDLMVAPVQLAKETVPRLLQVVLVLWDHYIPLVQDQAREMLVHLIHELVISRIEDGKASLDKPPIEEFVESVRRDDSKVVWVYDDCNGKNHDEEEERVPHGMSYVAEEVVKIFDITYPGIREELGRTLMHWANNCPVRHLACRSFQLFRCIPCPIDQAMLADLLARLTNTIADEEPGYQTFAMEILFTLETIIDEMKPEVLVKIPQLFWSTCACLDTIHEREFMQSLAILNKLLNKLDVSDPAVVKRLKENHPEKWEGTFEGVQNLVYKGVRSSLCLDRTLSMLDRLVILPVSEMTGDGTRLLFTVLANLPRFLHSFDLETRDVATITSAATLAAVAQGQGCDELAQALQSLADVRYRQEKDFLVQTVSAIRSSFFPDHEYHTLIFLMSLLSNSLPWFKMKTMQLLCVVIPDIDMRKPEIAAKGPDLISPVLRLLQTEFCPQALEVLDNVMTMTGTPMDKHHLRMSMAGSHSSRAFRKEYERTQSLYGIPEDSGWSIPMPAIHATTTRANVHAVFYTCATATMVVSEAVTPKVELVTDDYQNGAYFPDYRTATMMSDDTRGEGHMGELALKLDSLDDFFDDEDDTVDTNAPLPINSSLGRFNRNTPVDNRENLYDRQTLPILHKSLTRNPSVTSFQTGFADVKSSRVPGVMTPTAFTAPALPPVSTSTRPNMHSRSVTSPVVNQLTPGSTGTTAEETDEPFSDDDYTGSRSQTAEKPYSLESMIRPSTHGIRSGLRSGMRRLTGGGGDARDKEMMREGLRTQLQKSPEVPKVPDVYLQNPKSADP